MRIAFIFNDIIGGNLPFGMTTLAAMARDHGHVHDYFNSDGDREELRRGIIAFGPDVLAYSASSNCIDGYLEVNRRLRQDLSAVRSVFGGPHPTLRPQMIEQDGVDMVCVGEGEFPFIEYLAAIENGEEPTDIANLWIKHPDGTIERNEPRPFIQELDALPFADYGFVLRHAPLRDSKIAYIMAGRGCPYRCTYCINHILRKKASGTYFRRRSVDNVIAEIREIVARYGCVFVDFQDDIFAADLNWIREFAEKYPREVGLPYSCHITANLIQPELIGLLKQSRCNIVVIGLENGSERLRSEYLNKRVTNEQIIRASRLLKDNGIKLITQNMVGIPGETLETALETIELNIRCDPFVMNIWFFQPFPMIELTRVARETGVLPDGYSFPRSFAAKCCHLPLDLPNKEALERIGKLAFYLVDHPRRFRATRLMVKWFGGTLPTRLWLKYLQRAEGEGLSRRSFDSYHSQWIQTLQADDDSATDRGQTPRPAPVGCPGVATRKQ